MTINPQLEHVLAERGTRYGAFAGHAEVSQGLKDFAVAQLAKRNKTLAPDQKEALAMIFHKIGRIINGDPDYDDSWTDISGYAQLIANRLRGVCSEKPEKTVVFEPIIVPSGNIPTPKPPAFRFSDLAKEFRKVFQVLPDSGRGATLVCEEFEEWQKEPEGSVNDLKELADLVYVCYQYAEDCGYDLDEALRRVHASNMTKLDDLGLPIFNLAGKVLKSANYQPPHLDDLIK